jgi:microcompartment protein CcmK/EutM
VLLGRVVGTVVATRKDEKLDGLTLLVVQVHDIQNKPASTYVVAVDSVGAGVGEMVLYATGSSARQTSATKDRPVDAVIMAIIDTWSLGDTTVYTKD